MQTSYAKHKSRYSDPLWYFLAEYSLDEFKSDNVGKPLMNGALLQTIRDLGMPSESLNKIEMTLIGFVKETTVHFNQDERVFPVMIRLFYGKKLINPENSTKTVSTRQAKQTIEPAQLDPPTGTKISGGWGYFIIGRSGRPANSSERLQPLVDLYLYKEGE